MYILISIRESQHHSSDHYGVATTSRLLKSQGLFCKRTL